MATFTGCQLRFKSSVGRWSTLATISISFQYFLKGIWGESNSHLRVHSQLCSNRYTTDTVHYVPQHPNQDSNPEHLVSIESGRPGISERNSRRAERFAGILALSESSWTVRHIGGVVTTGASIVPCARSLAWSRAALDSVGGPTKQGFQGPPSAAIAAVGATTRVVDSRLHTSDDVTEASWPAASQVLESSLSQ